MVSGDLLRFCIQLTLYRWGQNRSWRGNLSYNVWEPQLVALFLACMARGKERYMDLVGRVAIVTGGGTGLGRAITHELASYGAYVAIVYSRSEDEARSTVEELKAKGGLAEAFKADVSDPSDVKRAVSETLERFGRLDMLFNNSGTTKFVPFQDLEGMNEDEWDRIMAVNVKGPWMMARAAANALRAQQGVIVNVSSIAGLRPGGSSLGYCVSKAALIHLTTCLAAAMAPDVRVNALAPGLFLTRWTAGFSQERIEAMKDRTPLKRTVGLEDLARMAVELARNDSMTGETVVVDAGLANA